MAFTLPNAATAAFTPQAEPDSVDIDILVAAISGQGVVSGCAVTAQGSPDMTVAVAAGVIQTGGVRYAVSSGNVTITAADGTNPRFDLIVADSAGAKQRRGGTAAASPIFPTPTAGDVVLAAVYVPASDTDIDANQITDKRAFVQPIPPAELVRIPYQPGLQTITSTATHGASLTNAWGGTFTIAANPDVDVELDIQFIAKGEAGDVTIHVLIDGTCILEDIIKAAQTHGRSVHRKTTVTGLSAGSRTIAVQGSVASGTGYLSNGAPPLRALLTVREAG